MREEGVGPMPAAEVRARVRRHLVVALSSGLVAGLAMGLIAGGVVGLGVGLIATTGVVGIVFTWRISVLHDELRDRVKRATGMDEAQHQRIREAVIRDRVAILGQGDQALVPPWAVLAERLQYVELLQTIGRWMLLGVIPLNVLVEAPGDLIRLGFLAVCLLVAAWSIWREGVRPWRRVRAAASIVRA